YYVGFRIAAWGTYADSVGDRGGSARGGVLARAEAVAQGGRFGPGAAQRAADGASGRRARRGRPRQRQRRAHARQRGRRAGAARGGQVREGRVRGAVEARAGQLDLLKKQYAPKDSIARADQDIKAAQQRIQATDLKLQYLTQL